MRALLAQLRAIVRSLRSSFFDRDSRDSALDDELSAYVDLLTDYYERDGLSRDDARRAALLATGGVTQVKEATRDAWIGRPLDSCARELRYALRSLRRSLAFVVIAVLTLGVGIGGATAIVSVISAVLLRPLPGAANPDELFSVERVSPKGELDDVSYADYLDFRDRATTIATLAGYNGTSLRVNDPRVGRIGIWTSYVSDNFFTVFRLHAYAGRLFETGSEVGRYASSPVAVMGYDLWKTRFHGDSTVVGSTLKLVDRQVTIIGIAPQGFVGAMSTHPMDLWVPLPTMNEITKSTQGWDSRLSGSMRLIGRRAPHASLNDVRQDLTAISDQLARAYPDDKHRGIRVFEGTGMTDDERAGIKRTPRLLSIAMLMLLLIACANVAGLTLVRASAKRRELATRLALGASRASLVRQLAIEAAILATLSGLVGIAIAQSLIRAATIMQSVAQIRRLELALDWRTLGSAVAMTAAVAMLVAIVPAFQISRTDVGILMKDGAGGAIRARSRAQRWLVVGQVAVSLVMLASASVLYGAFQRTLHIDPGFDPVGLSWVSLGVDQFDTAETRRFVNEVVQRARADDRLGPVALTSAAPPAPWLYLSRVFRGEETPSQERLNDPAFSGGSRAYVDAISDDFFRVLRVPFLVGRDFTANENARREPVAIVSRRLAEALWPRQNPIGRLIGWPTAHGQQRPLLRVVGVVADIRHSTLAAGPSPVLYVTDAQRLRASPLLVYRDHNGVQSAALRTLLKSMKSDVELDDLVAANFIDDELYRQRVVSAWVGVFGFVALVLAAIGVYGVIAQSVYQRTRELAVRAAVGARPAELLRLILADGFRLAVTGTVLGAVGVVIVFRVLRALFTGMQTVDLSATVVAFVALGIATLIASFIPARRAASLNPVDALRSD